MWRHIPEKLADSWESVAVAANNLNLGRNNIKVNGKITMIMFLSTRTDPVQKVKLEAGREPDSQITQVEISSPVTQTGYRERIRQRSRAAATCNSHEPGLTNYCYG